MVADNRFDAEYLLTLWLWQEEISGGKLEWRGRIRSEASGEVRFFCNWGGLIAYLREMLPVLSTTAYSCWFDDEGGDATGDEG